MNPKKPRFYAHENHPRPQTRREFLGQTAGILGTAFVLSPSILTLLARKAIAGELDCSAAMTSAGRIPMICVDLAGGANFAGSNVMVGKQGGQHDFLSSYIGLGLPDTMKPQAAGTVLNEEFGLVFHGDSAMLRGLKASTSDTTRARVDGTIFCGASSDDTQNNPHNPTYWIAASGSQGSLTTLVGTRNNVSGGNSSVAPASINGAFRPVPIHSPSDATALVQAGKLADLLSADKANLVTQAIERLSSSHLAMFRDSDLPTQIRTLVNCGFVGAADLPKRISPTSLDAALDTDVRAVFTNFMTDGSEAQAAAVAKMVLEGYAGAGTITRGGYDYHSKTRSEGEGMDEAAGKLIGQLLELAAKKNKDLMIYVFTDGGIGSNGMIDATDAGRNKGAWTGDDSEKSSSFMLVHRAKDTRIAKPLIRSTKRQIGWYKEGDKIGVDRSATLISNDVTSLSKAVVANYLALHGEEGRLADVVGTNPFGNALNDYLAFTKIR